MQTLENLEVGCLPHLEHFKALQVVLILVEALKPIVLCWNYTEAERMLLLGALNKNALIVFLSCLFSLYGIFSRRKTLEKKNSEEAITMITV